jgi:sugar O-acyltransferase (sialic acid O-acetyltransferase NeuD family)
MKQPLVIVGDSSFAELAFEYFTCQGKFDVVAFAVDRAYLKKSALCGRPIVSIDELAGRYPASQHAAFVALTYRELNGARARLVATMESLGYSLASFISDDARVWPNVEVGPNSFIFEDNVIQPFVKIGKNVILWSGNHIGHHSTIEDNVFIASHVVVSGHVTIGQNSFLGVNATVADLVIVGKYNWIGPNALITQDTPGGAMYRAESTPISKVQSFRFFKIKPDNV